MENAINGFVTEQILYQFKNKVLWNSLQSSWVQATYHWKGLIRNGFLCAKCPTVPKATPQFLMPVLDISQSQSPRGCQLSGAVRVLMTAVTSPESRKTPVLVQGEWPALGQVLHHLRAATSALWAPGRRRWPELYCIKQHLKLGRDAGESALPSAPRWPGDARFLLCLPGEAGLLPRKASRQPHGKWVSLLQLQEVVKECLSFSRMLPHISLQVPWAPTLPQHVGGNTQSPPLSQVAAPQPLQAATVRLADAPLYVRGPVAFPVILASQPALHIGWLAHGEGEACDFLCLFSENLLHHWLKCLVPAVSVCQQVLWCTVLRRIWSCHPPFLRARVAVINTLGF